MGVHIYKNSSCYILKIDTLYTLSNLCYTSVKKVKEEEHGNG